MFHKRERISWLGENFAHGGNYKGYGETTKQYQKGLWSYPLILKANVTGYYFPAASKLTSNAKSNNQEKLQVTKSLEYKN
jgi:hypothetical protein